ncbi:MAG: DUF4861 family protein [Paludibacter sp.]
MKKIAFSFFASLLLFSGAFAQRSVVVTNTSGFDRKAEMVELKPCGLRLCFKKKTYILKNENNLEIPYQVVYNGKKKPQVVIFQANVKANGSATYTFTEGKPAIVNLKLLHVLFLSAKMILHGKMILQLTECMVQHWPKKIQAMA